MHSYGPMGASATKSDQARMHSVPTTTTGETSSQRAPVGICGFAPEELQAVPRPDNQTAPNEEPESKPRAAFPCSSYSMDEAALAAMSQSAILDKEKGKSATGCGSMKMDKGKGKAVSFNEPNLGTKVAASPPDDHLGSAGGSITSGGSKNIVTAEVDPRVQRSGAPYYASDFGRKPTSSGASNKRDEGKADSGNMKDSTST
ncbi:uncharacterized protein M421DRAFT_7489 [Didymella exigua CBS 183.55]|uniref:Uncharacterized protein n=1 Tax=Didymella exigua CBS 183.55 TaxID=1150837 RepID=A0A6A5REX1_9PLEO|nr:uncharacterized protein M421DRAFT_7489 [Didymella exigua CBS 183.55]KAF1925989.1 hypothetical protein M421DRAFT_7489 [Didymella exigua CBS 183.55]